MTQSIRAGTVRRHLFYFQFISLLLVLFLWNPLLHKSLWFPMVPHHPQCKSNLPAIGSSRNRHLCAYAASFLITSHKALEAHQYRIDCFTQVLLALVQNALSLESLLLPTSCGEILVVLCSLSPGSVRVSTGPHLDGLIMFSTHFY